MYPMCSVLSMPYMLTKENVLIDHQTYHTRDDASQEIFAFI